MKFPSSTKCVQRVSLALAATAGFVLMAACGSSGPAQPNNNGFNASFLNGTYVFSSSGTDASNGAFLALAGAFSANGSGGITGGTMDVIDPAVAVDAGQTITSGSYTVSSDGRGQVKLASAAGNFVLDFVLTTTPAPSTHGLVTEFDSNGSGSGTLDLQTAPSGQSALAGPFAFSFSGSDSAGNPFATEGAFTLSSGGTSTGGVADFSRSFTPLLNNSLSFSAILGSGGTAPGTATFGSAYNGTYDFYPIDATHWKMIETDGSNFLAGDVYTQTGFTTIPSGTLVFTMGGITPVSGGTPIAAGGLMTSDGTGNFPSGSEDINNGGTPTASLPFSGTVNGAAGTGGRVQVTLTGFAPATQWVAYPSSGGVLLMEADTFGASSGSAFAQSATAFNSPEGYGLNLSGQNAAPAAVNSIAQFNATTATSNNMSGVLDENDQGTLFLGASLTGTYTPDSPATGRGGISATASSGYLGGFTLEYYTIDASDALFIDVDTSQVAVGTFEGQSGVSAGANNTAAVHRAESVVHPFVRKAQFVKKTN
jgi:hypothetical protein